MEHKYWQKLLIKWRENGRDGFSIPFIIGSQRYLPSGHKHQGIRELIVEMATNNQIEVYLKYCLTINDIILGVRDETKNQIPGFFPILNGCSQTGFFVTKFHSDLGNTTEEIIEALVDKYQDFIKNEEYSMNNRERGGFSGEEETFINECFYYIP